MPTYVFLSSASRTACTQLIFKEHGCMYVCNTKVTKTFACFFHKSPCAPTYLTAPTGSILVSILFTSGSSVLSIHPHCSFLSQEDDDEPWMRGEATSGFCI